MDNNNIFVGRLGSGKNMETTGRSVSYRESKLGNRPGLADVAYSRETSWDSKNSPRNEKNCLHLTSRGGVD